MTAKVRVSNLQVFMAVMATVIAYGHFVYVGLSFEAAGRDSWFSMVVGFALSAVLFYFRVKQASLHPNESLIQYTLSVFGTWVGGVVGSLYIAYFLVVGAFTLKELSSFLGLIYPTTPYQVFVALELLLIGWVVRAGGEVVTRVIQLLLPVLVFMGILASLFSMKDKDPTKLLPVLDHSVLQLSHGALMYLAIFCELIVFSMFWQDAKELDKAPKQTWLATVVLFLMFLGPATGPIMVFGERLCQILPYPTYSEIQYIRLTGIFERMDVVGVLLWAMGSYIRVSVFVLGATRGIAHLVGSQNENLYVLPVTIVLGGVTVSLISTSRELMHQFLFTTYPFIALAVGAGFPLLTAAVALFRRNRKTQVQPS